MTMSEIARLAGVSVSTVSKAFAGSEEISERTRKNIFKIAKDANCYSKYIKYTDYDYVIGVICPEYQSGYYTQQLAYFEETFSKRNTLLLTSCDNFDKTVRSRQLSYFCSDKKVNGVILYGECDAVEKSKIPVVSIGENRYATASVVLSNDNGMNEAIKHLKEFGHKDIAYVGEPLTKKTSKAFIKAMKNNEMEIQKDYIVSESDKRFESAGYEAMKLFLGYKKPPTAVVAAYDYIAFGVMKAINEQGLSVPQNISVIGIDDVKECDYINTPLTTISHYTKDLCEIVTEELFDELKNGIPKKQRIIKVSSQLIKRGSVGRAFY